MEKSTIPEKDLLEAFSKSKTDSFWSYQDVLIEDDDSVHYLITARYSDNRLSDNDKDKEERVVLFFVLKVDCLETISLLKTYNETVPSNEEEKQINLKKQLLLHAHLRENLFAFDFYEKSKVIKEQNINEIFVVGQSSEYSGGSYTSINITLDRHSVVRIWHTSLDAFEKALQERSFNKVCSKVGLDKNYNYLDV